jgi:FkbM family methyltransferase
MIIFDVGANDGGDTLPFVHLGDEVYCFEPVPYLAFWLRKRFKDFPNVHVIEKAVCLEDGEAMFTLANQDGNVANGAGSLCEFDMKNIAEHWIPHRRKDVLPDSKIKVSTVRLDTFIEQNSIGTIDYLHIDAQGKDLDVLKSLGKYLPMVKAGQMEVAQRPHLSIYKNAHTVDETKEFLTANGFEYKVKDILLNEMNFEFKRL